MVTIKDIIQDLKHDTPEVSVLEVIECLEQARDTISDLEAEVKELTDIEYMEEELMSRNIEIEDLRAEVEGLTAALKKITEVSVGVFPTNDPFIWLQDIAETALSKESE